MPFTAPPAIPVEHLRWHRCRRRTGHGVASGRAADSPYPAGSIGLQRPLLARLGLDLGDCFNGTLNLGVDAGVWSLSEPAVRVEHLAWTPLHPPETFSFWPCLLRWPAAARPLAGWIYRPHPETKQAHHQPADQLEVLLPFIADLPALESEPPGLELGVDGRHCRLLEVLQTSSDRVLELDGDAAQIWGR